MAFEPVPHFRAFLEYNIHLNNISHLVQIMPVIVSDAPDGSPVTITVPSHGIWGTAGIGGLNIDHAIEGNKVEELSIESTTLDTAVKVRTFNLNLKPCNGEW